jgi:predicted RNase H-like HicB family nuclease
MEKFSATYEYEEEGQWWIGYVAELPGANAQGRTLEETRENLREAVQLIVAANRELARRPMPGREAIHEDLLVAV